MPGRTLYEKVKRKFVTHFLLQKINPSFLIIGAQKAATSSLAYYLNQHPKIIKAKHKEVNFFNNDGNYVKGLSWYRKQFIPKHLKKQFIPKHLFNTGYIYFEATPGYMYRKIAIDRIREHYPKIKMIVLLRDPVERAYSAWNMFREYSSRKKLPRAIYEGYIEGKENNLYKEFYSSGIFPDFETCIEKELLVISSGEKNEEPSLIRQGIYIAPIENLYGIFPKNQILILGYKDLVQSTKETLNKILLFLRQSPCDWDFLITTKQNSRIYPHSMKEETRNFLNNFYKKYNEELFNKLGYKPDW